MSGFKSSFRSKEKPSGVANVLLKKKKEFQTKKGEKRISWRGNVKLESGDSLAISVTTDTSGKLMFVDSTKEAGQKVAFLDVALFHNNGGGL